ncbi:hypothetical protein [Helicobacter pylori]|nr:hypothetical protein [Helicobacter pylori]
MREFHSVFLIIGILQSLISNAFAHASMPLKARSFCPRYEHNVTD